jgi:hypothetical protein
MALAVRPGRERHRCARFTSTEATHYKLRIRNGRQMGLRSRHLIDGKLKRHPLQHRPIRLQGGGVQFARGRRYLNSSAEESTSMLTEHVGA